MSIKQTRDLVRSILLTITTFGLFTFFFESCSPAPLEYISPPTTNYVISSASDTTLFGGQGTRLFIEKGTFEFLDGSPVLDSIEVDLMEFYKKSDFVLGGLSTQSNARLLESGGMLNIKAKSKGKSIKIKRDKRIVLHFPKTKDSTKSMNLFFGDKLTPDSSATNWQIDTVSLVKSTLVFSWWGHTISNPDDTVTFSYIPKDHLVTKNYANPVDAHVNSYVFSISTIKEVGVSGVGLEFKIDKNGKLRNVCLKGNWFAKREIVSEGAKKEILSFMSDLPEFAPGRDKKGNTVEITGVAKVSEELIPLYKSADAYLKSFDKKYSRFEKQPIKNMDDAELRYYIFSIAKLGWINCDRFLESERKVDFIVQTAENKDIEIKMVFNDLNGVLVGRREDNKCIFSNVPIGRQVTIIAIANVKGQLWTAFKELTISDKTLEDFHFKKASLSELRQQLEMLN